MDFSERYTRQILFPGIGPGGQAALARSRMVVIGCGGLGSAHLETLVRAGAGHIRLIDRDFVEESNLQRQAMYIERDAAQRVPKAIAAAEHLGQINSQTCLEPIVIDVNYENVEELISGADVVLDGTDNFEARFLINDACIKKGIPWIYGAAVGSYGLTMTIVPGETPCLRCVFEEMPQPGTGPTCDTAGIIMPILSMISAIQTTEAIKLAVGRRGELHGSLIRVDAWDFEIACIDITKLKGTTDCPACCRLDYEYLRGAGRQVTTTLCGRNAVQISKAGSTEIDIQRLAERLEPLGEVHYNDFLLRFLIDGYEMTVFRDARSIVKGTSDASVARGLYSRFIGD